VHLQEVGVIATAAVLPEARMNMYLLHWEKL
jgi:hypothetical protein